MLCRSFIGSIVAASVLCLAAGAGAQTPDLSKSPDWSGQWKRTGVVAFACLHSRFASAQDSKPAPRSATPPSVQTPAATNPEPFERAILFVEDQNEGQRNTGMVRWRTRKAAGTQGAASKLVLEANIEITDGHLKALLSIMPSDDGSQSTIQMIEAVFTPLPGFIHGSISSLAGILVKEDEVKRGVPLARTGTATGANTFRVPLAQGDFEKAQNLRMLRDNPWISLAIVFSDGRRAVIAVEKGASGDKAVATALATWKQPGGWRRKRARFHTGVVAARPQCPPALAPASPAGRFITEPSAASAMKRIVSSRKGMPTRLGRQPNRAEQYAPTSASA